MAEAKQPEVDATTPMEFVATAPGTLGPAGIVRPGEKGEIPVGKFSDKWMRPAAQADVKVLNAYRKAKEEQA